MHVLTRDEIVRFGIDRRDLAETAWKFENGTRSMVRKAALVKEDGGKSWRLSQWRIICAGSEQFELDFQRPAAASASSRGRDLACGRSPGLSFAAGEIAGF